MTTPIIKIDRKAVDKLLKDMDLFAHTKVAVADYQAELRLLEERGGKLTERLARIQADHTHNLLKLEGSTTGVDEIINLKLSNVNLVSESKVVESLLEALEEEKTDLKVKHAPLFETALRADAKARAGKYNANAIVDVLRYEMIKAIADIGKEMQIQYRAIEPDVKEVFDDVAVRETHVRIGRGFIPENYTPSYSESDKAVIHRQDLFTAVTGQIPPRIRKPEGAAQ